MIRVTSARHGSVRTQRKQSKKSSSTGSCGTESISRDRMMRKSAIRPTSLFMSPPAKQIRKRTSVSVDSPKSSKHKKDAQNGSAEAVSEQGFRNNGLTCFINASLAVLLRIPQFVEVLEQQATECAIKYGADKVPHLLRALIELSSAMRARLTQAASGISTFTLTQVNCFFYAKLTTSVRFRSVTVSSSVAGTMDFRQYGV